MLIFKLLPGGLGWVGACKWPEGLVVWGPGGRPWLLGWSSRGWSSWWPSRGWSRCWPSWGLEPDSWLLTATSTSPRVPDLPRVALFIFYPHFYWLFLRTIGDYCCPFFLLSSQSSRKKKNLTMFSFTENLHKMSTDRCLKEVVLIKQASIICTRQRFQFQNEV